MKKFVKVALCQRSAEGTKEYNLQQTIRMIDESMQCAKDLDVIAFPEYNYYDPVTPEDAKACAETIPGPYTNALSEQAKKYNVNIVTGSFVESAGEGKVRNTVAFINREGEVTGKYSKIHLMDAINIKESNNVEAGNGFTVIDTDIGKIGLMVCYDLRFPELARSMVLAGADIIFCPAAFPTGNPLPPRTDHWDVLVKSTALYNLTYLCAINQFGPVKCEIPFGRTCVVDPWGTVVSTAPGRETIIFATLDMEYQKEIRQSVATWENRRPDIYKL